MLNESITHLLARGIDSHVLVALTPVSGVVYYHAIFF